MLDDRYGTLVALDFPFTVSPSGGGLSMYCEEEIGDAVSRIERACERIRPVPQQPRQGAP